MKGEGRKGVERLRARQYSRFSRCVVYVISFKVPCGVDIITFIITKVTTLHNEAHIVLLIKSSLFNVML